MSTLEEEFASPDAFDDLAKRGFAGFLTPEHLRRESCRDVPEAPGVYAVVWRASHAPVFLETSPGGWFKGKDPSVPIETLRKKWGRHPSLLYLGQSGGGGRNSTLRKRIHLLVRFGAGEAVLHWGGRYVWQLADPTELRICWREIEDADPRDVERSLLQRFEEIFGGLPFANLVH